MSNSTNNKQEAVLMLFTEHAAQWALELLCERPTVAQAPTEILQHVACHLLSSAAVAEYCGRPQHQDSLIAQALQMGLVEQSGLFDTFGAQYGLFAGAGCVDLNAQETDLLQKAHHCIIAYEIATRIGMFLSVDNAELDIAYCVNTIALLILEYLQRPTDPQHLTMLLRQSIPIVLSVRPVPGYVGARAFLDAKLVLRQSAEASTSLRGIKIAQQESVPTVYSRAFSGINALLLGQLGEVWLCSQIVLADDFEPVYINQAQRMLRIMQQNYRHDAGQNIPIEELVSLQLQQTVSLFDAFYPSEAPQQEAALSVALATQLIVESEGEITNSRADIQLRDFLQTKISVQENLPTVAWVQNWMQRHLDSAMIVQVFDLSRRWWAVSRQQRRAIRGTQAKKGITRLLLKAFWRQLDFKLKFKLIRRIAAIVFGIRAAPVGIAEGNSWPGLFNAGAFMQPSDEHVPPVMRLVLRDGQRLQVQSGDSDSHGNAALTSSQQFAGMKIQKLCEQGLHQQWLQHVLPSIREAGLNELYQDLKRLSKSGAP